MSNKVINLFLHKCRCCFPEAASNFTILHKSTQQWSFKTTYFHASPPFLSLMYFFHVCLYRKSQDHLCFFFLTLIFIQLIPPLIHLYIYLVALAITLYFFISLQRLSCRLIRNRCSWAGGYLQCVCGRREQFPGHKGLREERGSERKR